MFVIAIKLVAPVMAIILFVHMALGLTAKMVPQINLLHGQFSPDHRPGSGFSGLIDRTVRPYFQSLFEETGRGMVKTVLPLMGR